MLPRIVWIVIYAAALFAYHSLLAHFGLLTVDFKFWSFVIVTPIAKWLFLPNHGILKFFIGVVVDTTTAFLHFKILIPYFTAGPSWYYFLLGLAISIPILLQELFVFQLTHAKSDTYTVKQSQNGLWDFTIVFMTFVCYHVFSLYTPFWGPDKQFVMTPTNMIGIWPYLIVADFFFGLVHYLYHTRPRLWARHKIHHQYKGEELNSMANFYADAQDSFSMLAGFQVANIFSVILLPAYLQNASWMIEAGYMVYSTHSKYTENHMQLTLNFEADILAMALGHERLSSFHHDHHVKANKRFSIFGGVPDGVFAALVDGSPFGASVADPENEDVAASVAELDKKAM